LRYHFRTDIDPDADMKSRQSWADLYAFEVVRESDTPLFRQLYLQLRAAILSRRLRPGTKLPPRGSLPRSLVCRAPPR